MSSEVEQLQAELGKAQILLAFVLQEVGGQVTVPRNKPLDDGIAIAVDEEEDSLVVRLVTE